MIIHFFFGAFFFWAFWAALSWAFACWFFSLATPFLSPLFLSNKAFFLYFISKIAYCAKAFLSSGFAVFNFFIVSKVTP
jgi:hypothetical protein